MSGENWGRHAAHWWLDPGRAGVPGVPGEPEPSQVAPEADAVAKEKSIKVGHPGSAMGFPRAWKLDDVGGPGSEGVSLVRVAAFCGAPGLAESTVGTGKLGAGPGAGLAAETKTQQLGLLRVRWVLVSQKTEVCSAAKCGGVRRRRSRCVRV